MLIYSQLFQLITGQHLFEVDDMEDLVQEQLDMSGDSLPERWRAMHNEIDAASSEGSMSNTLQGWLEKIYFPGGGASHKYMTRNEDRHCEYFSRKEIQQAATVIRRMLRMDPDDRVTARDILLDPWFTGQERGYSSPDMPGSPIS